eukprot:6179419-Pleurochrysis_carterae.AAC.3
MKASRPTSTVKMERTRTTQDRMLAVTKPSGMDRTGTPDESPSRDAQRLKTKDSAPSGLLTRALGSPDSKAIEANDIDWPEATQKKHLL